MCERVHGTGRKGSRSDNGGNCGTTSGKSACSPSGSFSSCSAVAGVVTDADAVTVDTDTDAADGAVADAVEGGGVVVIDGKLCILWMTPNKYTITIASTAITAGK